MFVLQNMVGAWNPPEDCEVAGPPRNNPIVGHIVQRLFDIVHPPSVSNKLSLVNTNIVAAVKCTVYSVQ